MKTKYTEQALRAIKAAGGRAELARKLSEEIRGLSESKALWRVNKWAAQGVPHKHVIRLSRLSGVPAEEIRPDMYE